VEAEAEVEIEAEVGCCCTSAEKRDRYTRDYRHYRLQTTDWRLQTRYGQTADDRQLEKIWRGR